MLIKAGVDSGSGRTLTMKQGEWLGWWINRIKTSRFDPEDLHEMFICKVNADYKNGLAPVESAMECLEIIEDFIARYSEVNKC